MSTNPEVAVEEKKVLVLRPEEKQKIDAILAENKDRPGATMLVLTLVQEAVGYVSVPMQEYIADALGVPLGHLYGVLTFYSSFRMTPMGRHSVNICLGTACYVRGGPTLVDKFKQVLGVEMNDTTEDDRFTLQICRCVGACSQAPVVMIDDDVIGRVDPAKVPQILKNYE